MADISREISSIKRAMTGPELKNGIINAFEAINGILSGDTDYEHNTSYKNLIDDMGVGWNYGNVYDMAYTPVKNPVAYTGAITEGNIQPIEQYDTTWQGFTIMYTNDIIAWEPSEYVYEQNGVITMVLDVNNSEQTGDMDTLAVQLINHVINTSDVEFDVKFELYHDDVYYGAITQKMTITNEVTPYLEVKLQDIGITGGAHGVFKVVATFLSRPDYKILYIDPLDINVDDTYNLAWNTKLSEAVIDMLKEVGIRTIRLPVTWGNHTNHDGVIDEVWMAEIQRAVDAIVDRDLYCILNVHHDTGQDGWLDADYSNIATMKAKLKGLWMQIGERFKNYGHLLLFEGFNEILDEEKNWSLKDGDDSYIAVQELNQIFIDTVRSISGNNADRWLICNAYATNHDKYDDRDMVNSYLLPTDPANRYLVQYHIYRNLEGSKAILDRIHAKFEPLGLGIVIGEWAQRADEMTKEQRTAYAKGFAAHCRELGIHCDWWDDGGFNVTEENWQQVTNYGLIGKGMYNVWYHRYIAEAFVAGWQEGE